MQLPISPWSEGAAHVAQVMIEPQGLGCMTGLGQGLRDAGAAELTELQVYCSLNSGAMHVAMVPWLECLELTSKILNGAGVTDHTLLIILTSLCLNGDKVDIEQTKDTLQAYCLCCGTCLCSLLELTRPRHASASAGAVPPAAQKVTCLTCV